MSATPELVTLYKEICDVINDDGSLSTHAEHMDFAREGVHALKTLNSLGRENESLRSQLAEAQRLQQASNVYHEERYTKALVQLAEAQQWQWIAEHLVSCDTCIKTLAARDRAARSTPARGDPA